MFARSLFDADGPDKVDSPVRPGIGGIGSDHGAPVGKVHLAQVFDLLRLQVITNQVGSGKAGAAAVIKFLACGRIVDLRSEPKVRLSVA